MASRLPLGEPDDFMRENSVDLTRAFDQITNFCTEQQTANGVFFFVSIPFNDSKIMSPFSKDSINPIWDLQW